jgi:hypothetical protein
MRSALEIENKQLKKVTEDLKNLILRLENRVAVLEGGKGAAPTAAKKVPGTVPVQYRYERI